MKHLLLILLVVCSAAAASEAKRGLRTEREEVRRTELPPLYLPEAETVKLLTLGFNNFASDILWFQTVNYFGKQYTGSKDYRWLDHMCNLVVELDPRAEHVYEFCATLLAWVAKEPERSNAILQRAIKHHPQEWRYRYLHGFNHWYFLEDREKASAELVAASKLPGAPPFLASLGSRLLAETASPESAIAFLLELLKRTEDPTARAALEDRLKRAVLSRDLKNLQKAADLYRAHTGSGAGSLDDLVAAGILQGIPREPFGGRYLLDSQAGKVINSSGERGLEFSGKSAKTGIMKQEFSDER